MSPAPWQTIESAAETVRKLDRLADAAREELVDELVSAVEAGETVTAAAERASLSRAYVHRLLAARRAAAQDSADR